jgi:hypothetical protein
MNPNIADKKAMQFLRERLMREINGNIRDEPSQPSACPYFFLTPLRSA